MTLLKTRPGVMAIAPYVGGESNLPGFDRVIKLSSNENAFGLSPNALAAFHEAATDLHRYPDLGSTALRTAIADVHGLDVDRLVCGCGSDEFFLCLCMAYTEPGDEILYSEHGFLMYPIAARAAGAVPRKVAETNLRGDVDAYLAAVNDRTRIVFIANPNNPTGTYMTRDELVRLREGLPADILLVIDAAYAEFVDRADYTDGTDLAGRYDNVVMTRTFSKIYGLGGARIGWAYGSGDIVDVINRVRNPFNVSIPGQVAARAAILDRAFTEKCQAHNAQWIRWLGDRLRQLGITVPDSVGNFVLAQFPGDNGKTAAAADDWLRARGIIVRRVTNYGFPNALRITVGLEDELQALIGALNDFMNDR